MAPLIHPTNLSVWRSFNKTEPKIVPISFPHKKVRLSRSFGPKSLTLWLNQVVPEQMILEWNGQIETLTLRGVLVKPLRERPETSCNLLIKRDPWHLKKGHRDKNWIKEKTSSNIYYKQAARHELQHSKKIRKQNKNFTSSHSSFQKSGISQQTRLEFSQKTF